LRATTDQVAYFDRETECMDRERLQQLQLTKLGQMLQALHATNPFQRRKLQSAGCGPSDRVESLADLRRLPFTRKSELIEDQAAHPPFGTNLTFPIEEYVRVHQTSGSTGGAPLRCPDTAADWAWWMRVWGHVLRGAGVGKGDRVYAAFSFGPFIGFWSAYDCITTVGAMAIPGGGLQSLQRVRMIQELGATVLLCTPTYALRLAEVARENGLELRDGSVRITIHAGEPGASIPATRARIEQEWGALCHDHTGLSEIGATGHTCVAQNGVHLVESEHICEVIDPHTGEPVPEGTEGELVITNLGRWGFPLIRYRTGDRVKLTTERCVCGRTNARMLGGILGRADDMVIVRGVNVFPSTIEEVVRRFHQIDEFQIQLATVREMQELRVLVEIDEAKHGKTVAQRVVSALSEELHRLLSLRVPCRSVPAGELPRFELKAKRFMRLE
jgi:phenylacetate-CoA ligase